MHNTAIDGDPVEEFQRRGKAEAPHLDTTTWVVIPLHCDNATVDMAIAVNDQEQISGFQLKFRSSYWGAEKLT